MILELKDESASIALANQLARFIATPLVLTFSGPIGAGKTTLIRALLRALGVTGAIKSPTFSIVEPYQLEDKKIHHFDLYRISEAQELDYLGFRDYFTPDALVCIEWPEKAVSYLPKVDICFTLESVGSGRRLHMDAKSDYAKELLTKLCSDS